MHIFRRIVHGIIYSTRKPPLDVIARDTDRDYYMSAAEAKEFGVVDDILDKQAAPEGED